MERVSCVVSAYKSRSSISSESETYREAAHRLRHERSTVVLEAVMELAVVKGGFLPLLVAGVVDMIETFYMNGDGDPVIPLSSLPGSASFCLKGLDRTNSGSVRISELAEAVGALEREKEHNQKLYRVIALFFLFSALVAMSMGGVTWFIFQRTKDLKVDHQFLKSIQDNQVIRTASTDLKTVENRLVSRTCEDDFCPAVKISVGVVERSLSSTMSNSDLQSLKAVSVEGEGDALVFVKLHAFSRFAGQTPLLILM
eukprot:2939844-Rhodomonas_salina.2